LVMEQPNGTFIARARPGETVGGDAVRPPQHASGRELRADAEITTCTVSLRARLPA
jgi:hypothetical protein